MIPKEILIKISDYIWEIPATYRSDMRVPARIFATEKMLGSVFNDRSLDQLVNVATLQGICGAALAMPDAHEGYGFPIGGVAAMHYPDGIISPGGIGYDINCGVRLLRSQLKAVDLHGHETSLAREIYHQVPSGVGRGGELVLTKPEMDDVLRMGVQWMVNRGYATECDAQHIESFGRLINADPSCVSDQAKQRGSDQLGTIGSGNHFAEVDVVEEIYDSVAAGAFGLWQNQVVVLIHCGSRGLGHQVATDHIRIMMPVMERYGITLSDRELACVPFSSPEGQAYFNGMAAAANFAWANRQYITHEVRQAWEREFGAAGGPLSLVYDVAHNIAKIETYEIDGKKQKVIVHRKGATRAFGPGNMELIDQYRNIGQPVLIPGSMGTASYVLAGTTGGARASFSSCCHGAGRTMSRAQAKRTIHGRTLRDELLHAGIHIQAGSIPGLAEEAPQAYKDVDDVVDVVAHAGIARKVARLRPRVVIKG
jgi:tRNA-splicing ligase RtcB